MSKIPNKEGLTKIHRPKNKSGQKEKTAAKLRECILQSSYVLLLSATQMTIIKNINLQFIKSLAKKISPITNHSLKSPTNTITLSIQQ